MAESYSFIKEIIIFHMLLGPVVELKQGLQQQKKGGCMMVSFKLTQEMKISEDEKKMLKEAKKLPVVYDEDSPELTEDMEEAFIKARKRKPYKVELLTV